MKPILILTILFANICNTQAQQNIYVNQIGYPTHAPKYFYTDYQADSFALINTATKQEVLRGEVQMRSKNDPLAGFDIYTGDFSKVTAKGKYTIKVFSPSNSGITSYPFKISDDVFSDLLLLANRSMYLQRCGMEIEEQHAGKYHRESCHTENAHYHPTNKMEGEKDMTGGWHDAGDYGKYIATGAVTIATMLLAHDLKPVQFQSDDWNIPESGNNIPDMLDEIKYELDWMFKMQRTDGAVHEKIHTKDYAQFVMPSEGKLTQYIYEVSSTATADFAAIMAYSSRVFEKYDKNYSNKCLNAARNAYRYLEKHPEIFPPGGFKNPPDTKAGGYSDANDKSERLWAATELFFTTGEESYHEDFLILNKYFEKEFTEAGWNNPAPFAHYAYLLNTNKKTNAKVRGKIKNNLIAYANKHVKLANKDGFRTAMQADDYIWGSNGHLLNKAINLLIAFELTNENKYRNLALTHLDNVLGTNAMKMCYVTGTGTKRIMHLHHAPSAADNIAEPLPGIMTEGPNKYLQDRALQNLFTKDTPPAQTYVDDVESYASNENTIYGNASLIFVAAYLNALDFSK